MPVSAHHVYCLVHNRPVLCWVTNGKHSASCQVYCQLLSAALLQTLPCTDWRRVTVVQH